MVQITGRPQKPTQESILRSDSFCLQDMFTEKAKLEETEEELKCGENISPKTYFVWPVINVSWMRRQEDVQLRVIHLAFSFYLSHLCPQLCTCELVGALLRDEICGNQEAFADRVVDTSYGSHQTVIRRQLFLST